MVYIKHFYKGEPACVWCREHNVNWDTIRARMRQKGMNIDEAINANLPNIQYYMSSGESVALYCRRNNLNADTVRTRIREYGETPEEAIIWKNRHRYVGTYLNNPYGNLRKRCKDENHYNRACYWIKKGWGIENALNKKKTWRQSKMENKIWHTPDEKPKQEQVCVWEDSKGVHAGRFDTCYRCFCGPASYFVDLRKVKKWATVESLVASSKALEVAIDALKIISAGQIWECGDELKIATESLKQIKEIMKSLQ